MIFSSTPPGKLTRACSHCKYRVVLCQIIFELFSRVTTIEWDFYVSKSPRFLYGSCCRSLSFWVRPGNPQPYLLSYFPEHVDMLSDIILFIFITTWMIFQPANICWNSRNHHPYLWDIQNDDAKVERQLLCWGNSVSSHQQIPFRDFGIYLKIWHLLFRQKNLTHPISTVRW